MKDLKQAYVMSESFERVEELPEVGEALAEFLRWKKAYALQGSDCVELDMLIQNLLFAGGLQGFLYGVKYANKNALKE